MKQENTMDAGTVFVGAGIVSLLTVLEYIKSFERNGQNAPQILVVEKCKDVAEETSFANGGHVTLGEGLCVARTDTTHYMNNPYDDEKPGWLRPEHPLSKSEEEWRKDFLVNCKSSDGKEKLVTLAQLGNESTKLWQQLIAEFPQLGKAGAFQYRNDPANADGLLRIYDESKSKEDFNWDKTLLDDAGAATESLDFADLPKESGIDQLSHREGMRYLMQPGGCIDAYGFCKKLREILEQKGVRFLLGEEVIEVNLSTDSRRIESIVTKAENPSIRRRIVARDFAFSPGANASFRDKLGFNMPIAGLAGVTLTLPVPDASNKEHVNYPTRPIKLITNDGTIVISPLLNENGKKAIRVGGMFGFAGEQAKNDFMSDSGFEKGFGKHALEAMVGHIKDTKSPLHKLVSFIDANDRRSAAERYNAWMGFRPVAPDLMPVIGKLKSSPEKTGRPAVQLENANFIGLQAFAGTSYGPISARLGTQLIRGEKMHTESLDSSTIEKAIGIGRFDSSRKQNLGASHAGSVDAF